MSIVKNNHKIGIVLINWNGYEFTIPCIESIYKGILVPDYIIIVDNASIDNSIFFIKQRFPHVCMIENQINKGFAEANNQGIQWLLNKNVDYIWILNNDTIVSKDCLKILYESALVNPKIAAFSSKIYYNNPTGKIWYAGAKRSKLSFGIIHSEWYNKNSEFIQVEFLSGCCMFTRSDIWKKHGGFINQFIAYSEDSEWCLRLLNNGQHFILVPKATLIHVLSASVNKNSNNSKSLIANKTWFLMIRNHLWTIRIHCKGMKKIAILFINFLIILKNISIWVLTLKFQKIIYYSKGIYCGIFSKKPYHHLFNSIEINA